MSTKHNFIRLRRGTAAEWAASQPQPGGEILKLGEPGYEKDTGKLKIGDGITPWNSLPYFSDGTPIDPETIQDIIGADGFFVEGSGISIVYDDDNDNLIISTSGVSFNNHTHLLSDITDLSNNSRNFLLTPSSNNLQSLVNDETGSGLLVFNTSPNFSGIPTVPTAPSGNNTNQIASTSFVRNEIAYLIDSAPSTLDTLNELAAALGDDSNFATTVASGLANKAPLIHNHVVNDISDFNSGVSGLLPVKNIVSGTGISISSSSGIYTITSTGSGIVADQSKSLITTVFNNTGGPISKFNVVYINGGQGDMPTIALASASGEMTSSKTYGITAESISNMNTGKVIVYGALTGVNTDQFNPTAPTGDVNGITLWLSPTTPGGVTTTKPSAPNHMVAVGTIVRTHQNEGVVEVRIQNGYELEELHNVAISGATNGQFLQYNSDSELWVPSSSGNFSTLLVNGTGVSVSGHIHTSTSITDFNTAVSGLTTHIYAAGIDSIIPKNGSNVVTGANSIIVGGSGNLISGNNSVIGGGVIHTISANAATIPGGNNCNVSGFGGLAAGQQCVVNQLYGTALGAQAKAHLYSQFAVGAGNFSARGDAQKSVLIARRITTDATTNQILFLNGSSIGLTLPAQSAWNFVVQLSAYNSTDEQGGWWTFRGGIRRNNSNGTAIIGSVISENNVESSLSTASASVVANDTNDTLEIRVTGVTGKTIRWVATVDLSQVSFGTP